MDKELLIQSGVNYDEGLRRFAGHAALYEKYIKKFPADPSFQQLKDAMEAQDVQTAFRAAHTMKGAAGNLSFQSIMVPLVPLVEELRSGNLSGAQTYFQALVEAYETMSKVIAQSL